MTDKNQGEGNREAAKAYNKHTQDDLKTKDVDAKGKAAKDAISGDQANDLKKAEAEGKSKAKEFDPQVRRD